VFIVEFQGRPSGDPRWSFPHGTGALSVTERRGTWNGVVPSSDPPSLEGPTRAAIGGLAYGSHTLLGPERPREGPPCSACAPERRRFRHRGGTWAPTDGEPPDCATSPSPMVSTSACRVRSPLLAGSRLIPPMEGTKMFQFPSVCGAAPGFHTVRPRRPSDGGHTAAAVLSGAPAGARRPSLDFYPQGILVQRPPATRPREGGPAGHRASTEAYRMVSRPGYLRA